MENISSYLVYALICVPVLAAVSMLFFKEGKLRKVFTYTFAGIIAICSILLLSLNISSDFITVKTPEFVQEAGHYLGIGFSVIIAAIIIFMSIKYKNILALILSVLQILMSMFVELFVVPAVESVTTYLYFDSFSLIMVAIIGVIGSGICVYALGYMKDYNAHLKDGEKDRTRIFFALLFMFLSAMFVIVLSNNMIWMFTGWEITTVCSFLLIGYSKTDEAIKNSFRQINMNLLGGIAFIIALFLIVNQLETIEFDNFLSNSISGGAYLLLPLFLLSFAGITKAAQMPFHTWLLGAMVAPTPTSALLHSSTMVKAGVFLLLKLSPIYYSLTFIQDAIFSTPAIAVMLVGGISFIACSFMAISQTNAKRVLAYSTIANLGLITTCAGIGTTTAIWAAIMLIIFHACAKSLLFLCVGTAEHHIGSRNIEDMDALFVKMPKLARFMIVGMMAMFIAPFGMLISKWAALISFINANQIALILILAFGSAATFMFWAKWIGKLTGIVANVKNVEKTVHKSETISQVLMLVLTIFGVLALIPISDYLIIPYLSYTFSVFGSNAVTYLSNYGLLSSPISDDALLVVFVSVIIIALVLFVGIGRKNKNKTVDIYLAGVSKNNNKREYLGSMDKKVQASSRNMYLDKIFSEKIVSPFGSSLCVILMALALVLSTLLYFGIL